MNTVEEKYFPFDEAVLTSEIEFTAMDTVGGSGSIYYWKLRLFGCRKVNGNTASIFSTLFAILTVQLLGMNKVTA